MKTWILCVDQLGAKLYWRDNAEDPVHFWEQIPYPTTNETYIQYIGRMTRKACESEVKSNLIICAEPFIFDSLRPHLGAAVQARIIGKVGCNLCQVSNEQLNRSTQGFLEESACRAFSPAHVSVF